MASRLEKLVKIKDKKAEKEGTQSRERGGSKDNKPKEKKTLKKDKEDKVNKKGLKIYQNTLGNHIWVRCCHYYKASL